MYNCLSGLGWNLSGGFLLWQASLRTERRERVTPSQMHFASGSCHVRRRYFIAMNQPSESIMGLFKGVHLGVANLKVHIMLWDYF